MRFMTSAVLVVLIGLFSVGSATRCYFCSAIISDKCSHGVHTVDNIMFRIMECDGKCVKLSLPKSEIGDIDTTTKLCAPYVTKSGFPMGSMGAAENAISISDCTDNPFCHVCDGDLCNAAVKTNGVTLSVILTVSTLLFLLY